MRRISKLTLVILVALMTLFPACSKKNKVIGKDEVIDVADDDPEMLAAIARARDTLPEFWQVLEKPEHGEFGFALKVKITDKKGTEHFWAIEIERHDGKIKGTINNDPDIVTTVKLGDRIEIKESDISDWLYVRDKKMFGNETIRPLLKKMPAQEAERYKKLMANP